MPESRSTIDAGYPAVLESLTILESAAFYDAMNKAIEDIDFAYPTRVLNRYPNINSMYREVYEIREEAREVFTRKLERSC